VTDPLVMRTWLTKSHHSRVRVEKRHPTCGLLIRGWIQADGIEDTTAPGIAGHLRWRLTDYDHRDLGHVVGDYVTAEKALIDATQALEA
jgi:hypothetical protein